MDQPLISVIVPVYKVEPYLRQCVDSIRNQTWRNLEIILVDDGSPDRCGDICDELAREDGRIRAVHKPNGGLSDARNAGLELMTGELVTFVDSDDWIAPETYEVLYRNLTDHQAQISCCGIANWRGGGIESYLNPELEDEFVLDRNQALCQLAYNTKITNSACDKLYRAEIFRHHRFRKGILYEDLHIQAYLLAEAERVVYTARPLYFYRMSENSILRGVFSPRHYDAWLAVNERVEFLKEYHPGALPHGEMTRIHTGLNLLYGSRGRRDWDAQRGEILRQLRKPMAAEVKALVSRNDKIKLALMKIHPALFCWAARLAEKAR